MPQEELIGVRAAELTGGGGSILVLSIFYNKDVNMVMLLIPTKFSFSCHKYLTIFLLLLVSAKVE